MKYGWTQDYVDELDFDRIADAWREGKPAKGFRPSSDADVVALARHPTRWRRFIHGL